MITHNSAQIVRPFVNGNPLVFQLDVPEWVDDAICSQTDPAIFFPEKGGSTREAKRVCREVCPVREQCLQAALDRDERFGIWGGHSERERRKMKRAAERAAAAAAELVEAS